MRRWVVRQFGQRMELEDVAVPEPGAGEVRVRVHAVGINFADLAQRQGHYPAMRERPFVPGMECAGEVDALGPGVAGPPVGTRVMAVPIYGSHAELVCLPAERVLALPDGMSFAEGAAFPVAFLTADYALGHLARARAGETVVVTAAAGGVGTAILQVARLAGVRVIAVASPGKHALVRELGAEQVVDYGAVADLPPADLVLDSVGGAVFRPLWKHLKDGGRYVLYGFASAVGPRGAIDRVRAAVELVRMGLVVPYPMVTANRSLHGFNLSIVPDQLGLLRSTAARLLAAHAAGQLRPIVGRTFDFAHLPDAHAFVGSRASTGRVIVAVTSDGAPPPELQQHSKSHTS
jgi:NADPH:quinone reductase-like Zn-dependent oxidoreductase